MPKQFWPPKSSVGTRQWSNLDGSEHDTELPRLTARHHRIDRDLPPDISVITADISVITVDISVITVDIFVSTADIFVITAAISVITADISVITADISI